MAEEVVYQVFPSLLTAAEKQALTQYYPGDEAARALALWDQLPEYERRRRLGQTTLLGWRPSHGVTASNTVRVIYPPVTPLVAVTPGVTGPGTSRTPDLADSVRPVIPQPSGPFARAHPPDWGLAGLFPQVHGRWDDPPIGTP